MSSQWLRTSALARPIGTTHVKPVAMPAATIREASTYVNKVVGHIPGGCGPR